MITVHYETLVYISVNISDLQLNNYDHTAIEI